MPSHVCFQQRRCRLLARGSSPIGYGPVLFGKKFILAFSIAIIAVQTWGQSLSQVNRALEVLELDAPLLLGETRLGSKLVLHRLGVALHYQHLEIEHQVSFMNVSEELDARMSGAIHSPNGSLKAPVERNQSSLLDSYHVCWWILANASGLLSTRDVWQLQAADNSSALQLLTTVCPPGMCSGNLTHSASVAVRFESRFPWAPAPAPDLSCQLFVWMGATWRNTSSACAFSTSRHPHHVANRAGNDWATEWQEGWQAPRTEARFSVFLHRNRLGTAGLIHTDNVDVLAGSSLLSPWGPAGGGQLTPAQSAQASGPVTLLDPRPEQLKSACSNGVDKLFGGLDEYCALFFDGSITCWGNNRGGKLGLGSEAGDVGGSEFPSQFGIVPLAKAVSHVSLSMFHTCVIFLDGGAQCYGRNHEGQLFATDSTETFLGDDELPSDFAPIRGPAGSHFMDIHAGNRITCALLDFATDNLFCWGGLSGRNFLALSSGQQVLNTRTSPATDFMDAQVGLQGNRAVAVTSGLYHQCAIITGNSLVCWGDGEENGVKLLGRDSPANVDNPATLVDEGQVNFGSLNNSVASVSANELSTCVLFFSGNYMCFGENTRGMFGTESRTAISDPLGYADPPQIDVGGQFVSVDVGVGIVCALTVHGQVHCMGDRNEASGTRTGGAFGFHNDRFPNLTPIEFGGQVQQMVAGRQSGCALLGSRQVACWGRDNDGTSADGTAAELPEVASWISKTRVSLRLESDACRANCFAEGGLLTHCVHPAPAYANAALPPMNMSRSTLSAVSRSANGEGLLSFSTSARSSCILGVYGQVRCWGRSWYDGLGVPRGISTSSLPPFGNEDAVLRTRAITLETTNNGFFIVTQSRRVRFFGENANGIAGHGHSLRIEAGGGADGPLFFGDLDTAGEVRSLRTDNQYSVCAVSVAGAVMCWGSEASQSGTLGRGAGVSRFGSLPGEVPAANQIDVGGFAYEAKVHHIHACALLEGFRLRCWGHNYHNVIEAGNPFHRFGNQSPVNSAPLIPEADEILHFDLSLRSACAVVRRAHADIVRCWGSCASGVCGLPSVVGERVPYSASEDIVFNSSAISITGGRAHFCSLLGSGEVYCWGAGSDGQLASGSSDSIGDVFSAMEKGHVDFDDVAAVHVTCGHFRCGAILEDGGLVVWGSGLDGANGYGSADTVGDSSSVANLRVQVRPSTIFLPPMSQFSSISFAFSVGLVEPPFGQRASMDGSALMHRSRVSPFTHLICESCDVSSLLALPEWVGNMLYADAEITIPFAPIVAADACREAALPLKDVANLKSVCVWPTKGSTASAMEITSPIDDSHLELTASGGDLLKIRGSFWPAQLLVSEPVKVLVGSQECSFIRISSAATELDCTIPALSSNVSHVAAIRLLHTISSLPSPVVAPFTAAYTTPHIDGGFPGSDIDIRGGQRLVLQGSGFGRQAQGSLDAGLQAGWLRILVGTDGLECSEVVVLADSSVSCTMPQGYGNQELRVAIANFTSEPLLVSYASAKVIQILPSVVFLSPPSSFRALDRFTFIGASLARTSADLAITIGGVPCTDVVHFNSSVVSCSLNTTQLSTTSSSAAAYVTVGTSEAVLAKTPVQLFGELRIFAAEPVPFNNSGQILVVDGLNFGRPAGIQSPGSKPDIQLVGIGDATHSVECLNVTIETSNRLHCTVPAGVGNFFRIFIRRVQGWESELLSDNLRYLQPVVSSVSPSYLLSSPESKHVFVSFTGEAFGSLVRPTPTHELNGRIGPVPCINITFRSAFEVLCAIDLHSFRSFETQASVSLTVGGQQARVDAPSLRIYSTPRINNIRPAAVPISGSSILLDGIEFGQPQTSHVQLVSQDIASIVFGPQQHPCRNISIKSSTIISCTLGPLSGSLNPVVLRRRHGEAAQLVDEGLYVLPGQVQQLVPSYALAPALGMDSNMSIYVLGSALSAAFSPYETVSDRISISIGSSWCRGVRFLNSSALRCMDLPVRRLLPSATLPIHVSIDSMSAMVAQVSFEVYGSPQIDSVVPAIFNAAGGQRISILGRNFGRNSADVHRVEIGQASCIDVVLVSAQRVSCTSPSFLAASAGSDASSDMRIKLNLISGAHSGWTSGALQYDLPDIYLVRPTEMLSGHPSRPEAAVDIHVVGNALGVGGLISNGSMLVAGVNCSAAGGTVALGQSGSSMTCVGFLLSKLPLEVLGQSPLARVEVHTNVGLFVASELGTIQVMAPPAVIAVQPNPARQGDDVIIVGSNFGWVLADIEGVRIGSRIVPKQFIERTGVGGLRVQVPNAASDAPLDNVGLDVQVFMTSGWNATSPHSEFGSGIFTYLRTPAPPIAAPAAAGICGYREAADGGLARMEFNWPGDAVTAQFPVQQWAVQFSTVPWFVDVQASDLQTRAVSNIVGDDVSYVSAVSSQCRASVATAQLSGAAQVRGRELQQLIDASIGRVNVRVLSTPTVPFWLRVAAVTDPTRPADARGPFSVSLGPIYPSCERTEYLSSQFASRGEWSEAICRPCPTGALCGGQQWEQVTNAEGFYRVPWSAYAMEFVKCKVLAACPAEFVTHLQGNATVTPAGVFSAGRTSDLKINCAEGYAGPLCANCAQGFAPQVNQECAKCASPAAATVGFIFGLIGGTLALGLLMRTAIKSRGNPAKPHVALAKLLFVHLQQIALAAAFPMEWPAALRGMFAVFDAGSSLGDTLLSVDCLRLDIASSFVGNRTTQLLLPIVGLIVLAMFWSFAGAAGACFAEVHSRWRKPNAAVSTASHAPSNDGGELPATESSLQPMSSWAKFVVCTFVLFFMLQLNLTKSSLSLFTCSSIAGKRLLVGDLQFDCDDTSNHSWMYGLGVTSLFVYAFGVSAMTATALYCNRRTLQQAKTRSMYGFLYSIYRPEYWYWELVIQTRKICLAFIGVLLRPEGIGAQATFATTLMVLSSLAHNAALPFTSGIMNHFENASIVVTLITLSGGSTLIDPRATVEWKNLVSVLIVLSNSIYFASIFFILLRLFCADGKTQDAIAAALGKVAVRRSAAKEPTPKLLSKRTPRLNDVPATSNPARSASGDSDEAKAGQSVALLELLGGGVARRLMRQAFAARPSDRQGAQRDPQTKA